MLQVRGRAVGQRNRIGSHQGHDCTVILLVMSAPETHEPGRPVRQRRLELAAGIALIVMGVAVIAVVPQLRHCVSLALHGQFAGLRSYIRSLGLGGLLLLLGLMLAHAIVFYPSEIVTATAAYVYGFGAGLPLVVGGWLVSALLSYALGRTVGQALLRSVLGQRFRSLERAMERGGTSLLLSGRLIPVVPFALLGYAAGATRVSIWRFSWTTVLGYLPLTAAVAYLGSRAETLSASNPLVWAAAAVIVALLCGEWLLRHRLSAHDPRDGVPRDGTAASSRSRFEHRAAAVYVGEDAAAARRSAVTTPKDFDQAVEASHRALDEIARGNPDSFFELYSHGDDATLANPYGPPARGWSQIEDAGRRAASNYRDGRALGFDSFARYTTADLGYILEIERFETKVAGSDEVTPVALRVTSIFRLEEGVWKLLHRHADPITTRRPGESVVQA